MKTLFTAMFAMLLSAADGFSQQITDFNATFSYLCDDNYFNKGDSLLTFRTVGTTPLKMRRVRPAGWDKSKRLPAIIMYFGGGWGGDCAGEFKWMKNYFVEQGFVVLIAEYRLGAPIEQKAIPDSKSGGSGPTPTRWASIRGRSSRSAARPAGIWPRPRAR
jgi:hypothetical protein